MTNPTQSSRAIYERLLRGDAESEEYVAALRREAREGVIELKGWPGRWAATVVRAREAEAERDRYCKALEEIRDFMTHEDAHPDDGYLDALRMQDIASAALDQQQASEEGS